MGSETFKRFRRDLTGPSAGCPEVWSLSLAMPEFTILPPDLEEDATEGASRDPLTRQTRSRDPLALLSGTFTSAFFMTTFVSRGAHLPQDELGMALPQR